MTLSRRTLLAATTAVSAASLLSGAPVMAQPSSGIPLPPQAGTQIPGIYRYKVGEFEVTAVNEGVATRPLDESFVRNAPFSDVQAALERAYLPKTVLNIPFTAMVVHTGRNLVLIDCGFADNGGPTTGRLLGNLTAAGIDPKSIDTVIISHFHPDHIQGLRLRDGNVAFPNAHVMVPEAEWTFWMDDARMGQVPEAMRSTFQIARRVFGPMASDVTRYAWGKEIVPGITALDASGHTPGHTAFIIASGTSRLLAYADTTNHPALFVRNPDWSAIFDMDPDKARATRRRLLDMADIERLQLTGYHIPFPATGYVTRDGAGYAFMPVQWSPVL